ncbi:MAG TPA: hypothetical protein VK138_11045 [Acidiferrobacterales bacterium]|nr:hypothetical protein [Acidiferrobacterales bacterium]
MQNEWQRFLTQAGAIIETGEVRHFGHPQAETKTAAGKNVIADLSHFSLIRAHGRDAEIFLQAQLSNDIKSLNQTSRLAAYCNAQGRMLAIFRVLKSADNFLLQLHSSLRESILKRLKMFVLRAQVALESADEELARIGLSGPDTPRLLQDLSLAPPEKTDDCRAHNGLTLLRLPGISPRFEIIGAYPAIEDLWRRLKPLTPVGAPAWAWLDIMAGIPTLFPPTMEAFVPQMANLDLIGGISFEKGCYPGQEIVARTHYRGRLKQRMYRGHIQDPVQPQPGESLYAPNLPGQSAGTIVDAQPSPQGGYDLLAIIQISSAEQGELHLENLEGTRVEILDLPYPVAAAEAQRHPV